jgi:hypothetical protein
MNSNSFSLLTSFSSLSFGLNNNNQNKDDPYYFYVNKNIMLVNPPELPKSYCNYCKISPLNSEMNVTTCGDCWHVIVGHCKYERDNKICPIANQCGYCEYYYCVILLDQVSFQTYEKIVAYQEYFQKLKLKFLLSLPPPPPSFSTTTTTIAVNTDYNKKIDIDDDKKIFYSSKSTIEFKKKKKEKEKKEKKEKEIKILNHQDENIIHHSKIKRLKRLSQVNHNDHIHVYEIDKDTTNNSAVEKKEENEENIPISIPNMKRKRIIIEDDD